MQQASLSEQGGPPIPVARLLPGRHKRVKTGHPWVYSNEIDLTPELKQLAPGSVVDIENSGGDTLGRAMFNPHSLVAARMIGRVSDAAVLDEAFFRGKIQAALDLRQRLFEQPFYRLVHAEADGLPGLIIDRFGDVLVCQLNTAGMDRNGDVLLSALMSLLEPRAVVFRNDSAARGLEGLEQSVDVVHGSLGSDIELIENGVLFSIDPVGGQKTGWFYDHRANRAAVAGLSKRLRVLDVYTYLGAFGIQAAAAGADRVVMVDRSAGALDLAAAAAEKNGVSSSCEFRRGDAFSILDRMVSQKERFDMVIVDPPAFVKSRKDLRAGARGYRKMARLAAALVSPGGFLFAASCSHNVDAALFSEQVRGGLSDARRSGRVLRTAGAGPDHPVHPFLPESAYLKSELLQLD